MAGLTIIPRISASNTNGSQEVLAFELEGMRFGLPIAVVKELLRSVAITPLPESPPVVPGVVNVRGTIVPVVDLRVRFRLPPKPVSPADHLILVQAGPRLVAIQADRATDLLPLEARDIESASRISPGVRYLTGIAGLPDSLILILDPASFLSEAEGEELEGAMKRAADQGAAP